jgi:hypothetical protein
VTAGASPRWYACPSCFAVAAGLVEVRYALGLADVGPVWLCASCLAELYAQEQADRTSWDLERVGMIEPTGRTRGAELAAAADGGAQPELDERPKGRKGRRRRQKGPAGSPRTDAGDGSRAAALGRVTL